MNLKFCKNCVMDGTDPDILFNEQGICNHCQQAQKSLEDIKKERINYGARLKQIKTDGRGKKYDCLIGLSGGVDSSTTLHVAVKAGLRPLCFSIDNGWNDPKADENIMRLVEGLKVPFYRYTIDIPKFRELQVAFMKAGVPNIEIPTDAIILGATFDLANRYDIKWIVSGGNVATESIMPASWGYQPRDLTHIKDIYRRFAKKNLKGLPLCSLWKWNWYKWVKGIKIFYLLDYL